MLLFQKDILELSQLRFLEQEAKQNNIMYPRVYFKLYNWIHPLNL
jgi:hypothetical protein